MSSTNADFLQSLFREQSPGKPTPNGRQSSPGMDGFSFRTTEMTPDYDASIESEALSLLALFGTLAFLSAMAEESEMLETPSDSAEETPSSNTIGKSFSAGDRVRAVIDVEAVVAYNTDDTADSVFLRPSGHDALVLVPKAIVSTELIQAANDITYDPGRAYEDACGDTFIRRFDEDDEHDKRRWVNEFGEFTDQVCPPLKRLKAA